MEVRGMCIISRSSMIVVIFTDYTLLCIVAAPGGSLVLFWRNDVDIWCLKIRDLFLFMACRRYSVSVVWV